MTALDPVALFHAERAAKLPWRATPWDYINEVVEGLVSARDAALFAKLFGVVDDAGNCFASNDMLSIRLKKPGSRPRKALERLAACRFLELYERDGISYLHIRGYETFVGLQRSARPIYPPREGGEDTCGESAAAAEVSPPTPPSLASPADGRGESSRARGTRQGKQGERHLRVAAMAADEGDAAGPGVQPALALETPVPLSVGLERLAREWLAMYERLRPGLKPTAQRVPEAAVREEIRRLDVLYGIRALRKCMRRLQHEVRGGDLRWWGDPLANLERKAEWAWESMGSRPPSPDEGVEEGGPQGGESEPAPTPTSSAPTSPPPERDEVAAKTWRQALEVLQAGVEPWDYKHWILPVTCGGRRDDLVVLEVPDASHAEWVREHFGRQIDAAWGAAGGSARLAFEVYR